jgi:hypothetical protein
MQWPYAYLGSIGFDRQIWITVKSINEVLNRSYILLKRIGQHPINRIDELLPWNIDLDDQSSPQAS